MIGVALLFMTYE